VATTTVDGQCVRIAHSLRARRIEIEQAAMTRIRAVSPSSTTVDAEYTEGLRHAISAAFDYWIAIVSGEGAEQSPPLPAPLLEQARLAARHRVRLETVLRRYFAGFAVFQTYLLREAEAAHSSGTPLHRMLRAQAGQFDRLVEEVSSEHARAAESLMRPHGRRRADRVKQLLAGELIDSSDLGYRFDCWHLAAIAVGSDAASALGRCARSLSRHVLRVSPQDGIEWLWLSGDVEDALAPFEASVRSDAPTAGRIAIGEPASGMAGWRLSHRQACAAMSIARLDRQRVVRYCDVALLVTALQDDLLTASLRQAYLEPLRTGQEGAVLLDTLRAYFRAEQNASSTAPLLGVSRQTVANRIRSVEETIGRPLPSCAMEIQLALRLHDLSGSAGNTSYS
jgi:hypothetical protein